MQVCGSTSPNEVQASVVENGYALSIVALSAFVMEGACGRANYVAKRPSRSSVVSTLRHFGAGALADDITEVFVVRDAIAHAHLWTADVAAEQGTLKFRSFPTLLQGYGDQKFRSLVDMHTRTTRRLKLDVFPPRIHRLTAFTVVQKTAEGLAHLESVDPLFVYLTPVHIEVGTKLVPFYKWARQLPKA